MGRTRLPLTALDGSTLDVVSSVVIVFPKNDSAVTQGRSFTVCFQNYQTPNGTSVTFVPTVYNLNSSANMPDTFTRANPTSVTPATVTAMASETWTVGKALDSLPGE